MPQGLPRKIKLAFIVQALVGSILISGVTLLGGLFVRQTVLAQFAEREAVAFWERYRADPAQPPPQTALMTGYFERAGVRNTQLPQELRSLPAGLQSLPGRRRLAFVDVQPQGAFYLTFEPGLLDQVILWTALVSLLLSLAAMYLLSWRTYRTSKRMVVPVSWLADVVAQWDPRSPDVAAIAPDNLPTDSGKEVRRLSGALRGLGERITAFVQRERDFTRDASHELRTPLTVIRVATDLMLADPDSSPRAQRSLARVQRAGRDMEAVIDAFLILAREADIAPLSEEFEVRGVVDHEVERVRPLLAGRPIELLVVDQGAPRLFAPPHVLAVMVGNLLSNAARFTDAGRIELLIAEDRIEVRDSGIGMTPETLSKVFNPFYRLDTTREEGRGMGLSIVRRLGDRFGWPVSLSSEPGLGTTAVIRFA
ncbi:MAG TPA: HAMP domain-containing sensor histidine kinase [Lysobacter sp.]